MGNHAKAYKTPMYVLIRFVDYDAELDELKTLSPDTPCITYNYGIVGLFPVFTSKALAIQCREKHGKTDVPVACNLDRLGQVLTSLGVMNVVVDPLGEQVTIYSFPEFLQLIHDSGPGVDDS